MIVFKRAVLTAAIALGMLTGQGAQDQARADGWLGDSWFDLERPWLIRARGLGIFPDEDADIQAIGGDVDISNAYVPELDISYFINENIAFELIAATAKFDVEAENTAAGDHDLGEVWLLPPTLFAQYHRPFGKFKPYVGVGLNYTLFYGEDDPSGLVNEIDYSDWEIGYAIQAGADIEIAPNWVMNLDVKRYWLDVDVDVGLNTGATLDAEVDIDPWFLGAGVGYRF